MKTIKRVGLGVFGAAVLVLAQIAPAYADVQPQAGDWVGVGSDTVQFLVDFLADGINGGAGYNATSPSRRMINFDATGDACGAATSGAKVVLRAGQIPVTRPNGSGGGISAFLSDTTAPYKINFVRSSRLPSQAEQNQAVANGWGGLHVYQLATDGLEMAVSKSVPTNAPAALPLSVLVGIYSGQITTWGQVPGYAGPAPTNTIHPVIPQAGSGTRNFFTADLQSANGGTAITFGSNVTEVQEHDPNPIKSDPDAIGPFSMGRASLLNTGYCGAATQNVISLLNASGSYSVQRGLYVLARDTDVTSTTPCAPGGTRNCAQTLFAAANSWAARSANAGLISYAGVAPGWQDLGFAHS